MKYSSHYCDTTSKDRGGGHFGLPVSVCFSVCPSVRPKLTGNVKLNISMLLQNYPCNKTHIWYMNKCD